MKPQKRIYLGSVSCDCGSILIAAPEKIERIDGMGIMQADRGIRPQLVPSPLGGNTQVVGLLNVDGLELLDDPPQGHGELSRAGILTSTNGGDGTFPVFAEVLDGHTQTISIWFGFGPSVDPLVREICQRANLDYCQFCGLVERAAYQWGVDLGEFTESATAITAIEWASGGTLIDVVESLPSWA